MYQCPFCLPKIKNKSFYCNDYFFAIYNHAPIISGHVLIVPNIHFQKICELPIIFSEQLFPFVQKIMKILNFAYNATDFDISIQDGIFAGQTVAHLHVHVIPRLKDDCLQQTDWYYELHNQEKKYVLDSMLRPIIPEKEFLEITENLRKIGMEMVFF